MYEQASSTVYDMSRDDKRQVRQETRRAAREASEEAKQQSRKLARDLSEQAKRASQDIEDDVRLRVEGPIWARAEPGARKPRYTRDQLAETALAIADAEGLDAVSMRRVASELGAGTMTLYHYVRNKDELITLMSDAVMAEVVVPDDELADDWRTALTQIASRTRDAFSAHHWIFERMGDGRPGPNGLRHFEQSLRAVAGLGLDRNETFELIGTVDDYVFGFALRQLQEQQEHERGWPPEVLDFFKRELASGRYPLINDFFGEDLDASFDSVIEFLSQPGRFERGLNRLLDGIETEILTKPPK
jgi:AcrR family transcriptional regulator